MIHIRISEPALMTMTFNALEAFCLHNLNKVKERKSKSTTRLETGGHLFGHIKEIDDDVFYTIEFVSVDTTAKQTNDSIETTSLELKYKIANSFWPHLTYLGYFHTHPLASLAEMKDTVFASESDKKVDDHIMLILSIAHMQKAHDKGTRFRKDTYMNCVDFTLGDKRMCLVGYANLKDDISDDEEEGIWSDDKTEDVRIDCPTLMGLTWENEKFRFRHK